MLRTAGLIWQRDVGNGRMTRLRRDDLEKVFPGLLDQIVQADKKGPDRQQVGRQ
ncbi:ArsR family transcriptional regulator [Gordonia sp. MP11Mi]|uniref:ArsR family transcriptional regulator n=1 Tax=Gordonia sp. MP11Mi TaxID=3022769 RepID=UPI003B223C30